MGTKQDIKKGQWRRTESGVGNDRDGGGGSRVRVRWNKSRVRVGWTRKENV